MTNSTSDYQSRLTTPLKALKASLTEGCNIVLGHAAAAADTVMAALHDHIDEMPQGCSLFHVLYFGQGYQFTPEVARKINIKVNFMEAKARQAFRDGLIDHLPCHFHEVPGLFTNGAFPVDVAIIQVSKPNEEGFCSFGISCDYTKPAAEAAKIIIAEINENMPFIGGDNLIHISKLTHIIEVNTPLPEVKQPPIGEIEKTIGALCASLVPEYATLQLGIGAIPDAVLDNLQDRSDLGIHTEMFTDGVMHLMRKGVITGNKKTLLPQKVVSAFVMGSRELYDFIDNNPDIALYPVSYTNDPFVVAENQNMVSINSCLEVDIAGQVNAESIGTYHFSGSGGQVDFLRGAKRAPGGLSIIAMPSTAKKGTISRIVPALAEGSIVTSGRNEVDYIVTEFGIAKLRGKTAKERARALIAIAHPDFRPMLEEAAKARYAGF
ncbi:MAG: acetyl-CoA hydrolase/transferase C-terminal domain-containing protein [Porphyromonas sp.]|nr:acetyl-CoA hydrolase/transferase C-terminal domain-containing protein [Porphyromonas sp.]